VSRKQITHQDLARHLLAVQDASESFMGFVRLRHPNWKLPFFQEELINTLDALEKDELGVDNLLITMAPRHAKSHFGTVLFPSYFMARDPERYVMSTSYNAQLATDFGRQVRDIVTDNVVSQAFPDLKVSPESRAQDVWSTTEGGRYFAIGVGGTTSGRPANLLVVDDPIRNREDAESATYRNKSWNFYSSALATRLQPQNSGRPSKQIVTLTRWHPDDLAGRLMASEDWAEGRWHHLNYPAILSRPKVYLCPETNTQKEDPDEQEDVALWPERFPLEDLNRRRRLNPREFESLYQQQPFIQGGNLIKANWWRFYPKDLDPTTFSTLIITADTAFKKGEENDNSAVAIMGMDAAGDIYLVDFVHGRFDFPDLKMRLVTLNNLWRGKGLRGIYIEDKASGMSLIQELKRRSGMSVIPYKVTKDKVARVNSVLPLIEGGRVFLPERAPWLDRFIEECTTFPSGKHDDMVDAFTMGVDILSKTGVMPEDIELHLDTSQSLRAEYERQVGDVSTTSARGIFSSSINASLKSGRWRGWGA